MKKLVIDILLKIKQKISDDSDLTWTRFETADELRKEIDEFILRLNQGDDNVFNDISIHFLPTSTFQEHSLQNGWGDEFMKLAEQFDKIYKEQQ